MTENMNELLAMIERHVSRGAVFDKGWSSGQKAAWASVTQLHNLAILMEMVLLEADRRVELDDQEGLLRSIILLAGISSSIKDFGRELADWTTKKAAKEGEAKCENK